MSDEETKELYGLMREINGTVSDIKTSLAVLATQFIDHKILDDIRHKNDGSLMDSLINKGVWAALVGAATFIGTRLGI